MQTDERTQDAKTVGTSDGLGDDWMCKSCGNTAHDVGICENHDEILSQWRAFVEEHGKWKGEEMVSGLEGECFGYFDAAKKQMVWEACGTCGDIRWNSPNVES